MTARTPHDDVTTMYRKTNEMPIITLNIINYIIFINLRMIMGCMSKKQPPLIKEKKCIRNNN